MAQSGQYQWDPPLPPNWEARWDPSNGAYFYINHSTHSTQWVDPRTEYYAARQKTAGHSPKPAAATGYSGARTHYQGSSNSAAASHQTAAKTLTFTEDSEYSDDEEDDIAMTALSGVNSSDDWYNSFATDNRKKETKLSEEAQTSFREKLQKLKSWFPHCPEQVISQILIKEKENIGIACFELQKKGYKNVRLEVNEEAGSVENNPDLQKLQAEYPSVGSNLLQDVFTGCGNDLDETRKMLKGLGYHPRTSPAHHAKPSGKAAHKKKKDVTPAAPPEKSEHAKRRLEEKYESKYKSLPQSVVQMALVACKYEETNVDAILEMSQKDAERQKKMRKPMSPKQKTTTTSAVEYTAPAVLEPVAFGMEDANTPQSYEPSKRTTPSASASASTSAARATNSRGSTPRATTPVKTAAKKSKENTVLDVHHRQAPKSARVTRPKPAISTQPKSYESAYRTLAKGPDPTLCRGPDRSLLITTGSLAEGPNPDYHVGRDWSLPQGPMKAVGPDPSLRCGPQSMIQKVTPPFLQTQI